MNTNADLPPHLESIGRQLTATAHQLQASNALGRRPRSYVRVAVVPAAAAAAVAAVIAVISTAEHGRTLPTRPTTVAVGVKSGAKHPRPTFAPLAHPTAAKVLRRAAFVALRTSAATPRPDQFVYTETESGNGQITRSWLSVDGTQTSVIDHPGSSEPLKMPGCVNGQMTSRTYGEDGKPLADFIPKRYSGTPLSLGQAAKLFFGGKIPMDGPIVTNHCTAQPAFFPNMPTDPGALLPYLERTQGVRLSNLNDLAKTVGWLLDTDFLLPAQQAALYQFLATTPGINIQQSVKDVAGRQGIGVKWSFEGSSAMLIFDPATYQYLGTTTIGNNAEVAGDALLQTAVVDTAGQQPTQDQQPSNSPGQT
jgi:hypothetical protein